MYTAGYTSGKVFFVFHFFLRSAWFAFVSNTPTRIDIMSRVIVTQQIKTSTAAISNNNDYNSNVTIIYERFILLLLLFFFTSDFLRCPADAARRHTDSRYYRIGTNKYITARRRRERYDGTLVRTRSRTRPPVVPARNIRSTNTRAKNNNNIIIMVMTDVRARGDLIIVVPLSGGARN